MIDYIDLFLKRFGNTSLEGTDKTDRNPLGSSRKSGHSYMDPLTKPTETRRVDPWEMTARITAAPSRPAKPFRGTYRPIPPIRIGDEVCGHVEMGGTT
jgi:hypothetical protein